MIILYNFLKIWLILYQTQRSADVNYQEILKMKSKGAFIYILFLIVITNQLTFSFGLRLQDPKIKLEVICMGPPTYECYSNTSSFDETFDYVTIGKDNTFTIGQDEETEVRFAGFSCTAPYPVSWSYTQDKWLTTMTDDWFPYLRNLRFTYRRSLIKDNHTAKSDPSFSHLEDGNIYQHSALLSISNLMSFGMQFSYATGEYICSSADPTLPVQTSTKMRIFQEKLNFEKIFPLSGKNVTVWSNEGNGDDSSPIVFPCHVTNPDVNVTLYKKTIKKDLFPTVHHKRLEFPHLIHSHNSSVLNGTTSNFTWELVHSDKYFKYFPELGYVWGANNKDKVAPGSYKCLVKEDDAGGDDGSDSQGKSLNPNDNSGDDENEDSVIVEYKNGRKPNTQQAQMISPRTKFSCNLVNAKRQIFNIKCCSNSNKPPNIHLMGCATKDMCDRQLNQVSSAKLGLMEPRLSRIFKTKDNCRTTVNITFAYSMTLNTWCSGDGINSGQTCIFPLDIDENDNTTKPYTDWNDVEPSKLIKLAPKPKAKSKKVHLYNGQNVTFRCTISDSYFALGHQFKLNFINGTSKRLESDLTSRNIQHSWFVGAPVRLVRILVTKDIKSVSCFAAIIQSQRWVEKSVELNITDGSKPQITKHPEPELYWTLGQHNMTLKCEFSGLPLPNKITWFKDSKKIYTNGLHSHKHFNITRSNKTISTLFVDEVTYEAHGNYTCMVKNIFGVAKKSFKVYVEVSEEKWTIISVSIGLVFFACVAGFLGYKMWIQRKKFKFYERDSSR